MYMKDMIGNSISDDAEFDDLDDFDYVDQFSSKDDDEDDVGSTDDTSDDLDDLYVEDGEEAEDFEDAEEERAGNSEDLVESDLEDMDEELEARFICEECGHKWVDFVSETDEENDLLENSCPLCGSQNVTMES